MQEEVVRWCTRVVVVVCSSGGGWEEGGGLWILMGVGVARCAREVGRGGGMGGRGRVWGGLGGGTEGFASEGLVGG